MHRGNCRAAIGLAGLAAQLCGHGTQVSHLTSEQTGANAGICPMGPLLWLSESNTDSPPLIMVHLMIF